MAWRSLSGCALGRGVIKRGKRKAGGRTMSDTLRRRGILRALRQLLAAAAYGRSPGARISKDGRGRRAAGDAAAHDVYLFLFSL